MGNTWIYQGKDDDLITTDRVEGVVLFDGKPWHLLRSYERAEDQPAEEDVNLNADMWLAHIDGHECDTFAEMDPDDVVLKLGEVTKYFRYPATLGDSYKPIAEDPSIVVTVTALHEKVTTRAGEFDCVVYKETSADDPNYSLTQYVAPGIGIVKTIAIEAGETSESTLTSYTIDQGR